MNILKIAKEVCLIEAEEIQQLSNHIDKNFEGAIQVISKSEGKLIVIGMGKSGLIGKKMAATFASTGTPSFFLHPAEAYHGDLGMIEKDDIVMLISNSGETDEILKVIPFLKSQGNIIVSMTSSKDSTLGKNSDFFINIGVNKEACPLQLAPTSSTTATLVMGDAMAVVLMKLKQFEEKDFAKYHPGGSLGRRLLMRVKDVMKTNHLPVSKKDDSIKELIHKITSGHYGLSVVIEKGNIVGVVTDGDIRRAMDANEKNFFSLNTSDIMTHTPVLILESEKLTTASEIMNQKKINTLIVVNSHREFVGIVQMYDLGL